MTKSWPIKAFIALFIATLCCASGHEPVLSKVDVCGFRIGFQLPQEAVAPSFVVPNVQAGDLPSVGSVYEFLHAYYTYDSRKDTDGMRSMTILGMVMLRSRKFVEQGLSFLDREKVIQEFVKLSSDFEYEKVTRDGDVWIKRTKIEKVSDLEVDIEYHWLVPIDADRMIVFKIEFVRAAKSRASLRDENTRAKSVFESVRRTEPK